MGLFITFEGGEGSGKSTQAKALEKRLSAQGTPSILTHEPGGTPIGNRIRFLLKHDSSISPEAELLLFLACRAQLVTRVIKPGLEKGFVVICDRYADSTFAYQGYGRGLDMGFIKACNNLASQGLKPDLTILPDVPVELGLKRKGQKNGDRFEEEELAFHRRVREGYLKLTSAEPQRWLVVDGTLPRRTVSATIWKRVKGLLEKGLKA
ncbi:MAG: dTMP kinase [Chloroflexi bacterium]|nr:dTMP kinase [Chloroflexota bacterium]